jgi:hypothetical protein
MIWHIDAAIREGGGNKLALLPNNTSLNSQDMILALIFPDQ